MPDHIFTGVSRNPYPNQSQSEWGYNPPPADGNIYVCMGCKKTIDHAGICYVCWNTQDCYNMGGITGSIGPTGFSGPTGPLSKKDKHKKRLHK